MMAKKMMDIMLALGVINLEVDHASGAPAGGGY